MIAITALLFAACGSDDDDEATKPTATPAGDSQDETPEGTSVETTEPEDRSVFELTVGECFNDTEEQSEEATTVPVVPCEEPHDNEVYFEYEMEDGDFPGDEEVQTESFVRCADEFESFVGIPEEDSMLRSFPIYPTEASWENGDRVVYCAVYAVDLSKLTGSVEGSNR